MIGTVNIKIVLIESMNLKPINEISWNKNLVKS